MAHLLHLLASIRLLQLRGSKAVEAANKRFDATMTNVVRWQVRLCCKWLSMHAARPCSCCGCCAARVSIQNTSSSSSLPKRRSWLKQAHLPTCMLPLPTRQCPDQPLFPTSSRGVVQEAPNGGSGKQLVSDTLIRVQLQVPGWFLLPTAAIERTGERGCRAG